MSQTSIIVIEDFYDDPHMVRNHALQLDYPPQELQATYPGQNSAEAFWNSDIQNKLIKLVGEFVEPAVSTANGLFRITDQNSPHKQDIHIDTGNEWAGVWFGNEPEQCQGGTYFWRHKETKTEWCPRDAHEAVKYGFKSFADIQQKMIAEDGLDRSKWDLTMAVPMRFNRLVLFRPWMWHSHGLNFGTTKTDSRLVQLFFLSTKQENMLNIKPNDINTKLIKDFEEHHESKKEKPDGTATNPRRPGKYFYEKD